MNSSIEATQRGTYEDIACIFLPANSVLKVLNACVAISLCSAIPNESRAPQLSSVLAITVWHSFFKAKPSGVMHPNFSAFTSDFIKELVNFEDDMKRAPWRPTWLINTGERESGYVNEFSGGVG